MQSDVNKCVAAPDKACIPDKIVRLFRVLYDNSLSCVRTGGTHSSWFKIEAGVRQGCVLAPDSFATGMDWLLDRTVES